METSGIMGNRLLLGLRKVTATKQLKADHSITKPPSPECRGTYRSKTKKGLNKRGNKGSDMVLYVLQETFYRKLQESV